MASEYDLLLEDPPAQQASEYDALLGSTSPASEYDALLAQDEAETSRPELQPSVYPVGQLEAGNVDLSNRPAVRNADGSISTVRSISSNIDGREVLMPTVSDDGRIMSDEEAIQQYRSSGKHLGIFDNPDNATAYAEKLHGDQEGQYLNRPSPTALPGPPPGTYDANQPVRLQLAGLLNDLLGLPAQAIKTTAASVGGLATGDIFEQPDAYLQPQTEADLDYSPVSGKTMASILAAPLGGLPSDESIAETGGAAGYLSGAIKGIIEGAGNSSAALFSGRNLGSLPLGGGTKVAQRIVAGVFEGSALAGLPEQWQALKEAKTTVEKFKIATEMGLGLGIPAAAFAHSFTQNRKLQTTPEVILDESVARSEIPSTPETLARSEDILPTPLEAPIPVPETSSMSLAPLADATTTAPQKATTISEIGLSGKDLTDIPQGERAQYLVARGELASNSHQKLSGEVGSEAFDAFASDSGRTTGPQHNVFVTDDGQILTRAEMEKAGLPTHTQELLKANETIQSEPGRPSGEEVASPILGEGDDAIASTTIESDVARPTDTTTLEPVAVGEEIMSPGPGAASAKEKLASYELRRFGKRFQEDGSIDPAIREQTGNRYYEPISNKLTVKEALELIDTRGTDESIRLVRDDAFPMTPRVRVTIAEALIKKLDQSYKEAKAMGNDVHADEFLQQSVDTAEYLSGLGTTLGQGVQAFAIWNKLSPEGRLVAVRRMVKKSGTRHKTEFGPEIEQVLEGIKKTESAESTKATKVAKAEKETAIEREANKIARILSDTPSWSKIAKGKRNEALALIRAHLREEQPDFVNRLSEFGADRTLAESIDGMAFENRRRIDSVAEAREIQAREKKFGNIADRIAAQLSDTPTFTGGKGAIDPARQLILKHLVEPQPDFVQRIKQFGADSKTAETLDVLARNNRARVLAVDRAQRVEALRKQYTKNKIAGKLGKQDWERLVELNDAGLLNDRTFYEAVSERFGLPKFDKQVSADITRLNEAIEKAPEGFQRNEKTQDFLSYVADMKGVRAGDVPTGLWYANILSGLRTQIRNTIDTMGNIFTETSILAALDPKGVPNLVAGFFQGMMRGGFEAASVLKTGRSPVGDKISPDRILERTKFGEKGGVPISTETPTGRFMKRAFESKVAMPLNLWKYPLRAMVASDTLFFNSVKEARARFLARGIAKKEGLSGDALYRRVEEVLNQSPDALESALKQAQDEGLTGLNQRRRVAEIVEQGRDEGLTGDANEGARIATYNHEPTGVMGLFSHNIANITEGFLPGKFIAPFTRIVANVANRGLNYSPWGYKRLFFGQWGGKKFATEPPVGDAYRTQLVKATLGTTAMTAVALLDANDTIQITSKGPDNPEERKQMQNAGWKPYSVKIGDKYYSYQYTPFNLGFGMIGHYRDAIRYNKLSEKDAGTRLAYAMLKASSTIFDMSFLSGISDFIETVQGQTSSTKGVGRLFSRTASSVVIPNIVKEIDKVFDPTLYQADTITQSLIRETPIARSTMLKPMLNVLGEPIKPSLNILTSKATDDPVWKFIVEKQAWVSVPSKTSKIGDRPITADEYYRLIAESGPMIREYIQDNLGHLNELSGEEAQKEIRKQSDRFRDIVKSRF